MTHIDHKLSSICSKLIVKQNRGTEECSKFKVMKHDKFTTLEQMQVRNGTGPGVRRSKLPLLAGRIGYKCSMETSWNLIIRSKLIIRSSSGAMSRVSEISYLD